MITEKIEHVDKRYSAPLLRQQLCRHDQNQTLPRPQNKQRDTAYNGSFSPLIFLGYFLMCCERIMTQFSCLLPSQVQNICKLQV